MKKVCEIVLRGKTSAKQEQDILISIYRTNDDRIIVGGLGWLELYEYEKRIRESESHAKACELPLNIQ